MRIQHNIMAMNAYRNYNTNTSALSKNLEKLSSGYKINRAGDDAAGLAISEKMRAQITGLNAAQKNVKDGISLVKTAEGAMQEIQDMLNRMDYLATQSANGTYDDPVDRVNLNKEMEALKSEINRIAESANFNGIKLLDGSLMDDRVITPAQKYATTQAITLDTTGTCAQFHKAGVEEQKASFDIDLKQALHGVKASSAISANATFSLKVNVGGASVTVKLKANQAVGSGGVLTFDKMTVLGIATAGGTIAVGAKTTGISLTSTNGTGASVQASFSVSVSSEGLLRFEMKASKAAVDFNANLKVTISTSGSISMNVNGSANAGGNTAGVVSYNCKTQNVKNGVAEKASQLAHVHFDLSTIASKVAVQGGALHIGNTDITFNTTNSDTSAGKVGIKDLMKDDGSGNLVFDATDENVAELARRITVAAANDKTFTVGVGTDGKTIALEERYNFHSGTDAKDPNFLSDATKFEKMLYYGTTETTAASDTGEARGLDLQIGDTSDDFNRLRVSIGDMHVNAMGFELDQNGKITTKGKSIESIDIKSSENAKEAIDVIKNAINYVSSVRGDLGATQNRLEHTANNLSVMAENIQDAESTIRDTDIAEEMMSYTKNNILVQSAQAMLAQANAVPQGVLQLLG